MRCRQSCSLYNNSIKKGKPVTAGVCPCARALRLPRGRSRQHRASTPTRRGASAEAPVAAGRPPLPPLTTTAGTLRWLSTSNCPCHRLVTCTLPRCPRPSRPRSCLEWGGCPSSGPFSPPPKSRAQLFYRGLAPAAPPTIMATSASYWSSTKVRLVRPSLLFFWFNGSLTFASGALPPPTELPSEQESRQLIHFLLNLIK